MGLLRSALLAGAIAIGAVSIHARPAAADPGVLLEIESRGYTLRAHDRRSGAVGPLLRVTLGSPARSTPQGGFRPNGVIRKPGWTPGTRAQAEGARAMRPGLGSPMGIAKIPLTRQGDIALHGGGSPLLLGKPASGGCIRVSDQGMVNLLNWLDQVGVLGPDQSLDDGAVRQSFLRPLRVSIR